MYLHITPSFNIDRLCKTASVLLFLVRYQIVVQISVLSMHVLTSQWYVVRTSLCTHRSNVLCIYALRIMGSHYFQATFTILHVHNLPLCFIHVNYIFKAIFQIRQSYANYICGNTNPQIGSLV